MRKAWLLALLLSQLTTGCVFTKTLENTGRNYDPSPTCLAVYSNGKRLVASYDSGGRDGRSERWAEVDVGSMKWVPLKDAYDRTPEKFIMKIGGSKPEDTADLKKISLYPMGSLDESHKTLYAKLGIQMADNGQVLNGQILSGEVHRKDAARAPFTAYDGVLRAMRNTPDCAGCSDSVLTLIRDDNDHPGELQALNLQIDRDPHAALRSVAYPFAVALDIVTFPLQVLWYGVAFVAFHSHSG